MILTPMFAAAGLGLALMGLLLYFSILFAIFLLMIVSWWKIFTKAGKPGWACIVPIYNLIVLFEIAGKPLWWILLLLIPVVNVIILIITIVEVAKAFGHGIGFAIGMILLPIIFVPILGLGSSQYSGPQSA